ncbi:hypothetical protein Ciccas_007164 [Cichlidogyrus casuarinus]|uniref:Ras-related GTP-binding protein n=1 Tax=Cichlidogyrus casuarinus TaxID=1844966 RepID=A0ABD2Q676_9PLAT
MSPSDTRGLESTSGVVRQPVSHSTFINFPFCYDVPGQKDRFDVFIEKGIVDPLTAVIFVIDANNEYVDALSRLNSMLQLAYAHNLNPKIEVFIHKVDCLTEDEKVGIQREITDRINSFNDEHYSQKQINAFHEHSPISIGYNLTTIYDHSIFEAFSKVVQKLIPDLEDLEHLLNTFINSCLIDKVFILDVGTKIYLATDSMSADMCSYELCCDMIDIVGGISAIYSKCSSDPKTPKKLSPTSLALNSFHSNPSFELAGASIIEGTYSLIQLDTRFVLYMRGLNEFMVLVCLIKEEAMDKIGIINYNFQILKTGLNKVLEIA